MSASINPYPTLVGPLPFVKGYKFNILIYYEEVFPSFKNSRFTVSFGCNCPALIFNVAADKCLR